MIIPFQIIITIIIIEALHLLSILFKFYWGKSVVVCFFRQACYKYCYNSYTTLCCRFCYCQLTWEEPASEKSSNLPKVTQLTSDRARTRNQDSKPTLRTPEPKAPWRNQKLTYVLRMQSGGNSPYSPLCHAFLLSWPMRLVTENLNLRYSLSKKSPTNNQLTLQILWSWRAPVDPDKSRNEDLKEKGEVKGEECKKKWKGGGRFSQDRFSLGPLEPLPHWRMDTGLTQTCPPLPASRPVLTRPLGGS